MPPKKTSGKEPSGSRNSKDSKDIKNTKESDANKPKPTQDGDEEMTVVVPPSKQAPANGQSADADGDMAMDGNDDTAAASVEVQDPHAQAVAGESECMLCMLCMLCLLCLLCLLSVFFCFFL